MADPGTKDPRPRGPTKVQFFLEFYTLYVQYYSILVLGSSTSDQSTFSPSWCLTQCLEFINTSEKCLKLTAFICYSPAAQ